MRCGVCVVSTFSIAFPVHNTLTLEAYWLLSDFPEFRILWSVICESENEICEICVYLKHFEFI